MGKGKIRGCISILLAALLLCLWSGQSVLAEGTLQIGIDQYDILKNGDIQIYVNQNEGDGFQPTLSDSSLLIGKNRVGIESIKSFSELKEPVTYLCLVDVSGSITKEGMEHTKEVLMRLVEEKGQQDNFCITTMGNDVESSDFLTDVTQLKEAVDGITIKKEDTNLYYSITEAINVLKTNQAVHKKRCLLIFSDGADDQKKGITQKEAEDSVKESHIPIFTVMIESNLKTGKEEYAKILGSFARISAGGEHYAPPLDNEYEYADISGKIRERIQTGMVITASLENLKEVGDDTVHISVELSDGTKKASDGITVPAGTIKEAAEAIEKTQKSAELKVTVINENTEQSTEEVAEESAEEQSTEEVAEESAEDPGRINKKILIGIAALILVLLLVLILVVRKNSGREKEITYNSDWENNRPDGLTYIPNGIRQDEHTQAVNDAFAESSALTANANQAAQTEQKAGRNKEKNKKDKVQVTLFKVGPGEAQSYRLTVKREADIGRNKSCQLTLENDTALSGRHCTILYKEDRVFVKDEGSTNGTFVNGVPIIGEYQVRQDDILLIGSYEYRIVWE